MKKFFLAQDSYSFYHPEECSPMIVNKDLTMTRISTTDTPDVIFHNIDNYTSSNESVDFNVYIAPDNTNICFYSMSYDYADKEANKPTVFDCMLTFTCEITEEQAQVILDNNKKEVLEFFDKKDVNYEFTFNYNILENDNDFTLAEVSESLDKQWSIKLSDDYKSFDFIEAEDTPTSSDMKQLQQPKSQVYDINEDEIPF